MALSPAISRNAGWLCLVAVCSFASVSAGQDIQCKPGETGYTLEVCLGEAAIKAAVELPPVGTGRRQQLEKAARHFSKAAQTAEGEQRIAALSRLRFIFGPTGISDPVALGAVLTDLLAASPLDET